MAQVEVVIGQDGSATVELSLDPSEASALIAEAQRAASVSQGASGATPPPAEAPAPVTGPGGASEAPPEQPVGPDTLTQSGSPVGAEVAGAQSGETQTATGQETPPPAPAV